MAKKDAMATFGAVGDLSFAGKMADATAAGGPAWPFERVQPYLREADILFGNMESVLLPPDYPDEQRDPKGMFSQFDCTPSLQAGGFDFLNLATNHILDGGTVSMFHTRNTIEKAGIATGGVGRTQKTARKLRVLERNGLTFGFLCYCQDMNWILGAKGPGHACYEVDKVIEDVRAHRKEVDVLVASIHADIEFVDTPSVSRWQEFRSIADAGATLVLGHHPHVPQGIEMRNGSLIAYSLGNFLFPAHSSAYQRDNSPHTASTFVLLADVERKKVNSFRRIPAAICPVPDQRPVPLAGAARCKMLAHFDKLDRMCRDEATVRRLWRETALRQLRAWIQILACEENIERVIDEHLGRLLMVAENRNWVNEIHEAVREAWAAQPTVDKRHRPNWRYIKKYKM